MLLCLYVFLISFLLPEVGDGRIIGTAVVGTVADVLAVLVTMIFVDCEFELDVGEPTNVVVIVGIVSSAGVLRSDESFERRFTNSVRRSSNRPMRCDIRCISTRESTFISRTVAIKSRCAKELCCSRKPLSYVSDAIVVRTAAISRSMEEAFSSCSRCVPLELSRSLVCRSIACLLNDFESSFVSSMVSCRANAAGDGVNFCDFGKTYSKHLNRVNRLISIAFNV